MQYDVTLEIGCGNQSDNKYATIAARSAGSPASRTIMLLPGTSAFGSSIQRSSVCDDHTMFEARSAAE